jgi:hypothetical protein
MKQLAKSGLEHGLIRTVANANNDEGFKNMKPEMKTSALKKKKEDLRIVKAIYQNRVEENGILEMPYCEYAGEPINFYRFLDGHEYDVPIGLINIVNSSGIEQRSEVVDVNGMPTIKDGKKKRLHQFIPVGF